MLADNCMRLRRRDVNHKCQRMEPGLKRARAQRVSRQCLLHALAVLAAPAKLVQIGVLQAMSCWSHIEGLLC